MRGLIGYGLDGVVVPQTNSADEARRAVSACRYPPLGRRGFGPRRAGNYFRNQDEYAKLANDSVICAIQIEDVSGADKIDEIIRVPGIDWILVGPNDMSGTAGQFLNLDNPELWKVIRKIFDTAHAAGIPTGNAFNGLQYIEKQLDFGCQLMFLGEDALYLKEATDNALKVFRDTVKRYVNGVI